MSIKLSKKSIIEMGVMGKSKEIVSFDGRDLYCIYYDIHGNITKREKFMKDTDCRKIITWWFNKGEIYNKTIYMNNLIVSEDYFGWRGGERRRLNLLGQILI